MNKNSDTLLEENTVGSFLKKNRKILHISIRELSLKTKIREEKLIQLENNDFSKLPNKAYLKGYLRSIADALKVDYKIASSLLEKNLYIENLSTNPKTPSSKTSYAIDFDNLSFRLPMFYKIRTSNLIRFILVPLLILAVSSIALYSFYITEHFEQQSTTPVSNIKQIPLEKENIASEVATNKTPQAVKSIPLTKIKIEALNDDCWIAYKIDKNPIIRFTLKKGKNILLSGAVIRILIGNYEAIKISKNNNLITMPKNRNSLTANLIYPENLKDKYTAPYFIINKDGSLATRE